MFNEIFKRQLYKAKDLEIFRKEFLRKDGYFVIKIIEHNTSQVLASELLKYLWKYHQMTLTNNNAKEKRNENEDKEIEEESFC